MAPRPYNPRIELEGALDRANLHHAIVLAAEVTEDRRGPIDLELALRFLPLVAVEQPEHYDAYALRWLGRWISETPGATIEQAADVAASLADLPAEPSSLEAIRQITR
jgi:hypothetical protein